MSNIETMLTHYYEHTFDCPILYYNKKTDEIKYVVSKENNEINWKNFIINYSHIRKYRTTISIRIIILNKKKKKIGTKVQRYM